MRKRLFILHFFILLFNVSCSQSSDGVAPSTENPSLAPVPTSPPAELIINSPVLLSQISNTDLVISGQCDGGSTVFLAGDDTQNFLCVTGLFSFSIHKSVSGDYFFNLNQSNTYGSSGTVSVSWHYDINTPTQIILSNPLSNPFTSGDTNLNLSGACETGATVNISGAYSDSVVCSAGAFSITGISKSVDGSYIYNLSQTDTAGNTSASLSFNWIRDTSIPSTPTITNFSDNPHYTNSSPLTISGACTTGYTVSVYDSGVLVNSMVCSMSTYSLAVAKGSNGSYSLSVIQSDTVNSIDSASRDITWVYDSIAPSAPVITTPTSSSITSSGDLALSGSCENNATVNLSGDAAASVVCSGAQFSFDISKSLDGTYNFNVTQTDLAGNVSASDTQQWIRDSSALPIPTILTPNSSPFISNVTNLVLSGECQNGLTVTLSGVAASDVISPAGSLTSVCTTSAYSFTINKLDGTYSLSVSQTNGISTSASASLSWIKDTVEPNTTITSNPNSTNYSTTASFAYTSSEPATYQCSLNSAAYSTCSTPLSYTSLTNGAYTLNIRSVDLAGNIESTPATYAWTQSANNTIALYHLNASAPMLDSSNYGGGNNNTLTDVSSTNQASGKFSEARTMATTSNYASAANTSSQGAISSYLTLEAWIKLNSLPVSYAPVASKINTTSSLASFEYGLRKQGSKYYIYFRGSNNGTSYTEVRSSALTNAEVTALTSGYNHMAVTWNLGSIKYYFGGVSKGTSTIGTVGSSKLALSNAALRLGYNGSTSLAGDIDEVRISQIVRWNSGFTPSATEYTAD